MSSSAPFPIVDGKYTMEREPIVRIGVILEEDGASGVDVELPGDGYTVDVPGQASLTLSGESTAALRIQSTSGGTRLQLLSRDGRVLVADALTIRLVPPVPSRPLGAGDGTLVRDIIAGRGFHWAKKIDQTLTHTLEFIPANGNVVMVNELPLETYLTGVITGEMSNECPIEYMKAQAVAARSWLLGQPVPPHPDRPFLWCNDDCCQRYQGTGGWNELAIRAIDQCRGEVLITPSGHYCDARYSKSTGGISEDSESVWGVHIEGLSSVIDAPAGSPIEKFFPVTEANLDEYLDGEWLKTTDAFASPNVVPEATITRYLGRVDEVGEYFRWDLELTQANLVESLTKRGGLTDLVEVLDFKVTQRGRSGRISLLDVRYRDRNGAEKTHTIRREYYVRAGLSMKFLYSSAFRITPHRSADGRLEKVTLRGAGWGHGAGLCQIGGLGRALKGQDYRTILLHYYIGVRLERIYK
ncbi:SpoIID/LytB domain-containing protein [bacterium]|nr:SpoIID/LytB domain-containing protein [bacterium]